MADDLVARLREKADRKTPNLHMEMKRIETEAADRIEQLEAEVARLRTAIGEIHGLHHNNAYDVFLRDDATYEIACEALEIRDEQ